ncbi:MAG: hypothetical protein ABIQ95_01005, partial [Bdellovibrionia bacterium]
MYHLSEGLRSQIGLDDPNWVQFLKKWLLVSLGLHLIAGLMSTGFYDVDEHFQIIEFVSYKLGQSPASALPHEFLENCRSWLQPTLYEVIARTWRAIGIVSPAYWAASFRIFSALLGWLGLVGMALCAYRWFPKKKYRELSVKLGALLYFLPYLHARTSSENLGGTFFVLAVTALVLLIKRKPTAVNSTEKSPLNVTSITNLAAGTAGFLLGLSFLSRFQMGFMIFGLGIWCLLIARIQFKSLLLIFLGIAASVGLGIILDWRGTGAWTISPYNYFFSFQKAAASPNVTVSPWWGYFQFLAGDVPLLGNLIAAGVIAGWVAQPKNPFTVAALPFVLIHMAIPHKEPRYLFPLISIVPTFVTFGIELMERALLGGKELKTIGPLRWARNLAIFLNAGGLLVATLKPAAIQPLLHSYIFDHQQEIPKLHFIESNPFELNGLPLNFYRPPNLELIQTSYSKLAEKIKTEKQPQWLFYPQLQLPPEA